MADPAKHKSVSVPIGAWKKANFLKDKIIDGTELSISKVIESTINEKANDVVFLAYHLTLMHWFVFCLQEIDNILP